MSRQQRHGQRAASQHHREICDAATLGEEFRLTGKAEADLVEAGFAHRGGHHCGKLAPQRALGSFLQTLPGGARGCG